MIFKSEIRKISLIDFFAEREGRWKLPRRSQVKTTCERDLKVVGNTLPCVKRKK